VAYEDPLASMFTWDFNLYGWTKYPKFYESDELGAPEILQDIRALLMDLKFKKPAVVQAVFKQCHGWMTAIFKGGYDEETDQMKLDYTFFSEHQCKNQDFIRQNKEVLGWRVQFMPHLPFSRNPLNVNLQQVVIPNTPDSNIIFDTRGDEKSTWGYGISIMEKIFDPLAKLRMESDSDSFRKAIFPMGIMPPDWDDPTIDKFFEKASNMSRSTAFTYSAAVDKDGKLYENIPALTFMSPSDNVKQTGSGQFGGLSAEWTRLLAATKHTMGYIVGGGAISSSQAAAGVDLTDDQKIDINEWNLLNKNFIKKFLKWLEQIGVIPPLPPFTVKCHWEWAHDEMMAQQSLMMERDIAMQDEEAERNSQNPEKKENELRKNVDRRKEEPWERRRRERLSKEAREEDFDIGARPKTRKEELQREIIDLFEQVPSPDRPGTNPEANILDIRKQVLEKTKEISGLETTSSVSKPKRGLGSALESSLKRTKARTEESKRRDIAKGADTQQLLQLDPEEGTTTDIALNQWLPVNSASGNVEGVYLDEGDGSTIPTIFVSFGGGNIYSYQDTDITDPEKTVQKIMADGGEAVWEELRASKSMRSGVKPGKHPKGGAKTGGGKFAYAGSAHMRDYQKARAGPVAQGLTKQIGATDQLSRSLGEQTRQTRERTKALKSTGVKKGISKGIGALGSLYSKAWNNELPSTKHLLIQKHNSISGIVRDLHHSKTTVYKMLDVSIEVSRQNSMHWGNSFSTTNPFLYENDKFPSGYSVEYQCPKAIQKLIGVSVPVWIEHKNSERTEEEFVGTYNITGWDEQNGKEIANYNIDWDLIDEIFERERVENWIKPLREQGKYPDTSTEYTCKLSYDRERSKYIQTDFNLIGLALVQEGNCSGTVCSIKDT